MSGNRAWCYNDCCGEHMPREFAEAIMAERDQLQAQLALARAEAEARTAVARGLWEALGSPAEWLPFNPWLRAEPTA